jgi:2-keto-4-pentenoate hydratase
MTSLTDQQVQQAAEVLLERRRTGSTIAQLPSAVRPGSYDDAYRIQLALHGLIGEPVALLKVGCTAEVTQQLLDLDEPIGGRLVADQIHRSGVSIPVELFHHPPLIECEFAFRIAVGISATEPLIDDGTLRDRVDAVAPALELADGRYDQQLGIDGPSIVADNSMAAAVVLGDPISLDGDSGTEGNGVPGSELASVTVRLEADLVADVQREPGPTDNAATGAAAENDTGTETIAVGVGSEVLGDPWRSLLWVVRHEQRLRNDVDPGTWVITGSCAGAPPAPLDRRLTARFAGLGDVAVTITSNS